MRLPGALELKGECASGVDDPTPVTGTATSSARGMMSAVVGETGVRGRLGESYCSAMVRIRGVGDANDERGRERDDGGNGVGPTICFYRSDASMLVVSFSPSVFGTTAKRERGEGPRGQLVLVLAPVETLRY